MVPTAGKNMPRVSDHVESRMDIFGCVQQSFVSYILPFCDFLVLWEWLVECEFVCELLVLLSTFSSCRN